MKIKDVVTLVTQSISPEPDTKYHLYSLPSYDENQTREEVFGSEIQSNKYFVPNRCILFNKLNVRFKRIWAIDNHDDNKLCSTEFLPLVVDESKVDFNYCLYLLQSESITDYLCGQNANTSGSHKRIDPQDFLDISIHLPQLEEQKRIGNLLASIDAKIRLNRAINRNLEALAKQLYDYWFVQFDFPNKGGKPYKTCGGKMVWSEKLKHEIPALWQIVSVNDIAELFRGVSYTKEDLVDESLGVLVLRGNNIQENQLIYDSNVAYIPQSFVSTEQRICKGEIIMTMSSGSKEHVGKCVLFHHDTCETYGAFLTKFSPHSHCSYLLYEVFNSAYFKAKIKSIASGTGINNLTNQTFDNIYIALPPTEILKEFDKVQHKIFSEVGVLQQDTWHLIKQRDELLPLLMNGQVSLNSCCLSI